MGEMISWSSHQIGCEKCGYLSHVEVAMPQKEASKVFRLRGWSTLRGRWVCPECKLARRTHDQRPESLRSGAGA